ncbi:MAG: hypothetical protein AAFX50_00605 [Acidobacteriota bacterium]
MFAPSVTGEYLADSSFVRLSFERSELDASVQRFRQLPNLRHLADASVALRELSRLASYDPPTGPEVAPVGAELFPFLTFAHENEHHRIVSTTPFGLAVWRAYQSLRSDLNFLFIQHSRRIFVDFEAITVPGAERFQKWLAWRSIAGYSYVDMVCWECLVLREFIVALLNNRQITRGEFVALASTAEVIMAKRSGIERRRAFAEDVERSDEPLVGEDDLTPLEIMEATATLHEESIMRSTQVARRDLAYWQRASLHGIYEKAHRFFRQRFGYIRFAKLVGDLTFWGPADIAAPGESLDIDDYHPSIRLRRLVDFCRGKVLPSSLYQRDYPEIPLDGEVFDHGIRATMEALLANPLWNDKFIGGSAYVPDGQSGSEEQEAMVRDFNRRSVDYGRIREQLVKRSIQLQLGSFNRLLMASGETPFRSLVTIFDDGMDFLDLDAFPPPDDAGPQREEGDSIEGGGAASLAVEADGDAEPDPDEEERAHFFLRALQDYAQSCAVKQAVFGAPAPAFFDGDGGALGAGPASASLKDYYRSFFPA